MSTTLVEHLKQGPFPGRIDPWAEAAHYFQQIHSGMIGGFLAQIQEPLLAMGYVARREASLQITDHREPDVFVQRAMDAPEPPLSWNYDEAAAEILAEPGILIEPDITLQALAIKRLDTGRLVTVVEVVSPGNKTRPDTITAYRTRREKLILERGVNVVEIDATRSVKRLFASDAPYHIAIFIPGDSPRLIEIDYNQPLSRMALPLRGEVIPLEVQHAYDGGYQAVTAAAQLHHDGHYTGAHLPFSSLLTDGQRIDALQAVQNWQADLARLREGR